MKVEIDNKLRMADGTVAIVKQGGGDTLCIVDIGGVVLANIAQEADVDAVAITVEEWSAAVQQVHDARRIRR